MTCQSPKATRRIFNAGTGAFAWCPSCKSHVPAHQVPWGQELRNSRGEITATFAPKPHGSEG